MDWSLVFVSTIHESACLASRGSYQVGKKRGDFLGSYRMHPSSNTAVSIRKRDSPQDTHDKQTREAPATMHCWADLYATDKALRAAQADLERAQQAAYTWRDEVRRRGYAAVAPLPAHLQRDDAPITEVRAENDRRLKMLNAASKRAREVEVELGVTHRRHLSAASKRTYLRACASWVCVQR